jgi:hypothetical protein
MTAITEHRAPFRCLRRFVPPHEIGIRLYSKDSRRVGSTAKTIAALNQITRARDIFAPMDCMRTNKHATKYHISSPVDSINQQLYSVLSDYLPTVPLIWANFAGIELIEIKSDSENSAGSNSPARRNVAFI